MYADNSKRKLIVIGVLGLLVVAILGLIGGVLFMGKPLEFQYANAQQQVEEIKKVQESAMDEAVAYFNANTQGEPADKYKKQLKESADTLTDKITKLENEAAIVRDEEVQKAFQDYKKGGQKFIEQVEAVITTVNKTEALRSICSGELFDAMAAADNREAGWEVFEPCAAAAETFNPNEIPDPDYRLLFVNMKKIFKDTKTYLTQDPTLKDDINLQLATLNVTTEQVDLDVQTRLRETLNMASIDSLESLLVSRQEK